MSDLTGFRAYFDESRPYTDGEVAQIYLHHSSMKVTEIAKMTGRSLPEFYRALRRFSIEPNRHKNHHDLVHDFHRQGHGARRIAELTGYTTRNVRYILAKGRLNES